VGVSQRVGGLALGRSRDPPRARLRRCSAGSLEEAEGDPPRAEGPEHHGDRSPSPDQEGPGTDERDENDVSEVQGRLFVGALRWTSKSPVAYAEIPGAQHAFEIFHSLRTRHVIDGVDRFLGWVRSNARSRDVAPAASGGGQAA
jgi:hypothetical protein